MHRQLLRVLAVVLTLTVIMPVSCYADITGDNGKVLPSVTVNIPVKHVIGGDSYHGRDRFSFVLHAEDEMSPMPEGSDGQDRTVTIGAGGKVDFGDIIFDYPGVYYYRISRQPEKHTRIREDDTEYRIMIASLNDGSHEMTIHKVSGSQTEDYGAVSYGSPDNSDSIEISDTGKESEILFRDVYSASPKTGDSLARLLVPASSAAACIGIMILMLVRRREDHDEYQI